MDELMPVVRDAIRGAWQDWENVGPEKLYSNAPHGTRVNVYELAAERALAALKLARPELFKEQ